MNLIPKQRMPRFHKETYKLKQFGKKVDNLQVKSVLCGGATYPAYTKFVSDRFENIFRRWW